ncbi:MAG TPA: hypothetical protein VGO48_17705 [Conexibacter sp.]|jgi:hypothetical protein|nr:hypothetical protein [Conexibacter sp.]
MSDADVPFEALGARRFQSFCQSLVSYEFPAMRALPVGQPDGGRDAYVVDDGRDLLVFQVKFVERPDYLRDADGWLRKTIARELPKIQRLARDRQLIRYVLVTNVPGSAHPGSGSIDIGDALLDEMLPVPAQVWWRDDLLVRLAKHHELKWSYRELLTGQDVLDQLVHSQLNEDRNRRGDAIAAALAAQYEAERTVRFKQVDLHNDLFELFVDVPLASRTTYMVRGFGDDLAEIYEGGDDDRTAAILLDMPVAAHRHRRLVIEGAPGQGKSTLAQYVCQVHRLRLVGRPEEAPEIRDRHADAPLRLPFKVDLREFATFLDGKDPFAEVPGWGGIPSGWPRSLEGFLALQVQRYGAGARFDVSDLFAVARTGPLLLMLDGLDEVADVEDRKRIVQTVESGLAALDGVASSVLVVVTSRPAAFANSPGFSPKRFEHLALISLTRELIRDYAERWVEARRLADEEAAEVLSVLEDRLEEPHMRELARNPMQLAILLSLISTKGESLPDRRTELYHAYMTLFFDREAAKSRIVRKHRALLFGLHGDLAWRLHCDAERSGSGGTITLQALESAVRRYVVKQGVDEGIADDLFQGVVERIVAIVATHQERFEFEVQPLREFFAAHHLYATGQISQFGVRRPGTRADRFAALARNGFWLNVLRFYAGFYMSGELPSLADGLVELARDEGFQRTSTPRMLAATLLQDWSFELDRRSRERAVDVALEGFGARHALGARLTSHLTVEPSARLPDGAGREEVVARALRVLARQTLPRDRRTQVTAVLAAHVEPRAFAERWTELVLGATGSMRTAWVEVGCRMGAVRHVSDAVLHEAARGDGDEAELARRVTALLHTGLAGVLEQERDLAEVATERLLAGDGLGVDDGEISRISWLQAFQSILRLSRRPFDHQWLLPVHDVRSLEQRPPTIALWRDVVLSVNATVASGCTHLTQLSWRPIVELCERSCGERPLLIALALAEAGSEEWLVGNKTQLVGNKTQLVGSAEPLVERVLGARARTDDGSWWCEQLTRAATPLERQLVAACAGTFVSGPALERCLVPLGRCLNALSVDDYRSVSLLVTRFSHYGALKISPERLARLTPRLALLLASRNPPTREQIWRAALTGYRGWDPAILSSCAGVALAQGDWNTALRYLRAVTRRDASGRTYLRIENAPVDVARQIVDDAARFPLAAVDAAERRLEAALRRRALPLSAVAKRERWFARTD